MSPHSSIKALTLAASLAILASPAQAEDVFSFDEVDWLEAGVDGVQYAILWGEEADASAVYAYRIQPGAVIPLHLHPNDYWGLSVQGRWIHIDAGGNEEITAQGEYVRVPGGALHGDSCAGPEVCINIVDSDGPSITTFPE